LKKFDSVTEYIDSLDKWKAEILLLRELCLEAGFTETIKWSIPTYTINHKNVVGIAAFKNHSALWFFNGVFLNDPYKKLINAQKGSTKGQLQWRFSSIDEIQPSKILEYLNEAIANEKAGLRIKVDRKKELILPAELEQALSNDIALFKSFDNFTPFKKREFADYISEAKRDTTKHKRLEKCIPLIQSGIGLNDKYR
jgi:uncharacterized protein YdeI (YjbR/CyaY-like superfamily)